MIFLPDYILYSLSQKDPITLHSVKLWNVVLPRNCQLPDLTIQQVTVSQYLRNDHRAAGCSCPLCLYLIVSRNMILVSWRYDSLLPCQAAHAAALLCTGLLR